MKKYLRLFGKILQYSLAREIVFRSNFFLKVILNIFWYAVLFGMIEIIFFHTDELGGWNKTQIFLLFLTWIILEDVFRLFFQENLARLPILINNGELDLLLTKPINHQFLLSMRTIKVYALTDLVVDICLFLLFAVFWLNFTFLNFLLFIFLLFLGVTLLYSFTLIVVSSSFWFLGIENVIELWHQLTALGRFPAKLYPPFIRLIGLTVIPFAVITNFPPQALVGELPLNSFLYAIILSIIFFLLASLFFRFACRHYASASS